MNDESSAGVLRESASEAAEAYKKVGRAIGITVGGVVGLFLAACALALVIVGVPGLILNIYGPGTETPQQAAARLLLGITLLVLWNGLVTYPAWRAARPVYSKVRKRV